MSTEIIIDNNLESDLAPFELYTNLKFENISFDSTTLSLPLIVSQSNASRLSMDNVSTKGYRIDCSLSQMQSISLFDCDFSIGKTLWFDNIDDIDIINTKINDNNTNSASFEWIIKDYDDTNIMYTNFCNIDNISILFKINNIGGNISLYNTIAKKVDITHDKLTTPPIVDQPAVSQISAGGSHSLIILTDGTLWVTGKNDFGQLGLGDVVDRNEWTQVGSDTDWTKISAGYRHSLAVKGGVLFVTGANDYGQLGLGTISNENTWIPVWVVELPTMISAGGFHSIVLNNNIIFVSGRNDYGQLGIGNNINKISFVESFFEIPDASFFELRDISAGMFHSLLLVYYTLSGYNSLECYSTGSNYYGQLGLNDNVDRNEWTFSYDYYQSSSDDVFVEAGVISSFSIDPYYDTKNYIFTGYGEGGQLGNSVSETVISWSYGSETFANISSGGYFIESSGEPLFSEDNFFTIGITDDRYDHYNSNFLMATGMNQYSQTGLPDTNNAQLDFTYVIDTDPEGQPRFNSISAGGKHALSIDAYGNLWGTGNNVDGELGQGITTTITNWQKIIIII